MKIAFIASAFHRAEAFASVCKSFEKMGHTVFYYPLYMKAWENGQIVKPDCKNDDELKKAGLPRVWDEVFTLAIKADVVLFWKAESVHPKVVEKCGEVSKTIYYSWDDPYQLECDPYAISRATKCHVAFTCCEKTAHMYESQGAGKGLWLPPGYDPEIHYEDGKPEVDVCFVATNTYCKEIYGDKCFDRRDLIRAVLEVTKSVELYGTGKDALGWLHPVHGDSSFEPYYKGRIPFDESRKAFSRARLCLSSHVRRNGVKYFNERTFQVLGCKRVLVMDRNPGCEEIFNKENAILYDSVKSLQLGVEWALKNPSAQTMIAKNGHELSKEYTWDKFCEKLLKGVE